MIRDATLEDLPRLVDMVVRFIATTEYRELVPAHPDHLAGMFQTLIESPNGVVLVSVRDACVTGMFGILLIQNIMSGELTASELFWWVEPEARGTGIRLMRRAQAWARDAGAVKMQVASPNEDVSRIYTAMKFRRVEEMFQLSL